VVVTDYISDVHGNDKSQLPKERKVMPENKGTQRVSPPSNVSARSSGKGEAKKIKKFGHIGQTETLS